MKKELERNKKRIVVIGVLLISIIAVSLKINKENMSYSKLDTSKTMAVYIKNDLGTYEKTTSIPTSGYTLNTEKSLCSNGATPTWVDNTLQLSNLSKNNTSCYLYFDKIEGITIPEIIAGLNAKTETPDFSVPATTDERVYATEDGMYGGTTYYWRGATTTNYVKFAGFCWRIIRINGDGSMRLIYDGTTCHANGESTTNSIAVTSQAYNANYNRSEYVGWTYTEGEQQGTTTDSNAKSQTETWYNTNLASYASKIADGKFCNDRTVASGYTWSSQPTSTFYYAGYDRSGAKSSISVAPTTYCMNSGDIYTLKVGAVTMDEVIMAGGVYQTANSSYYLYNNTYYWTMSPYRWYLSDTRAQVVIVYKDGYFDGAYYLNATNIGVRPVINLKSDTLFKTGTNGTIDSPYEVI